MNVAMLGLTDLYGEPTMYIAKGHDVDPERIRRYAAEEECHDLESAPLGDPRNAWGRWVPYTGEIVGDIDPDSEVFEMCEEGDEGAEPYTLMDVGWSE